MFFTWMIVGLPLTLLCIGVGVACLWLPRGRKVGGNEPRCAACGYIVQGLPEPKCPECGSDLTRPNAINTTGRLPPGRLARSVAWSFFCVLAVVVPLAAIWGALVMPAMPMVRDSNENVTFGSPASKGYQSIAILAHTYGLVYRNGLNPLPRELKIELTRSDGSLRALAVDPVTLHYRDSAVPGSATSSTPLDANVLVSWLKSQAVQGQADLLEREMSKTMQQLQQVVSRPENRQVSGSGEFHSYGSGGSTSLNPIPWVGWVPVFAAVLVWSIGMIRIVRKPSMAGDSHIIP